MKRLRLHRKLRKLDRELYWFDQFHGAYPLAIPPNMWKKDAARRKTRELLKSMEMH